MVTKKKTPRLLKRDWQVKSIPYEIDTQYLPQFVAYLRLDDEQTKNVRKALLSLSETLAHHIRSSFQEAVKNGLMNAVNAGLNEAVNTVLGEEYREMVEAREKAYKERSSTSRAESKKAAEETKRRQEAPTRDELVQDLRRELMFMASARRSYHAYRKQIQTLIDTHGKEIVTDWIKDELEMPEAFIGEFDVDAWVKAVSEVDIEEVRKKRDSETRPPVDDFDFFDSNDVFEDPETGE